METEDLKSRIEIALARGHLSQWQRQFLLDIHARLERHGSNARLSQKQLAKVYEALNVATPAKAIPLPPSGRRSPPRWQPRRRSLLAREARYWAANFAKTFAVTLALVIGSLIYSYIKDLP